MHYKRNNKESKTYVQGLRSFGNTLPRGFKGILKRNGYNYSEIINKWNILVGKNISSCSYPKSIKIKPGNKNGTLLLAVERGSEITVEYSKNEIVNKINSYFGYKLINEVKLETFNSNNKITNTKNTPTGLVKKFSKKIYEIKSENIRNSLSKLLEAVKND
jgi:hypothetical protein|tara:strand:- start:4479 stop:4961 length:483 start_codon:yes stop_codon:yes gene_type:complete